MREVKCEKFDQSYPEDLRDRLALGFAMLRDGATDEERAVAVDVFEQKVAKREREGLLAQVEGLAERFDGWAEKMLAHGAADCATDAAAVTRELIAVLRGEVAHG